MARLVLLFLTAALVLAPSVADAAAKRTCRSGETMYKQAGVRASRSSPSNDDEWLACGPRTRRPVSLYPATGGYANFRVAGRSADKALFVGEFSGEGGGEDTTVGWFDARTSEMRSGELAGGVSNEVRDVIVTADGGVGVASALQEDAGLRVGYLAAGLRKGELRGEVALSTAGGATSTTRSRSATAAARSAGRSRAARPAACRSPGRP